MSVQQGNRDEDRESPATDADDLRDELRRERRRADLAHAAFDAFPQITWLNRPDGSVEYFNARWVEYTGLSTTPTADEWKRTVHPDDFDEIRVARERLIGLGQTYHVDVRLRRHDGQFRWHLCTIVPTRGADGAIVSWLGTAADVHEQRQALEQLRREQELLAFTHEVSNAGAFEWNIRDDVNVWSPQLEELYGLPAGSFAGRLEAWARCVHPDDLPQAQERLRESLATGTFVTDFRIIRPDGRERWIHARAKVLFDDLGKPERMIGINLDVTDRKAAEEAARVAREEAEAANRTKDEFLAALSHELRTPLSPVLMMTQLWEREPGLPDQLRKDLAMVRRNVEIETRLIDDLLDLTRIARGKLQLLARPVDLHALVIEAAETCSDDLFAQKRLVMTFDLSASDHWVSGDPARLGQVLWNLLKNAIKFTPPGGAISVATRPAGEGRVAVSVTDTGVGIEPEILPDVFNAFEQGGAHVTRRFGGLGLGLAISKAITELHGGGISAWSAGAGRGATFTIELCTVPTPTTASDTGTFSTGNAVAAITPASGAAAASRSILLVEDHESTGRVMRRLLAGMGYDVHWADSAGAAMKAAEGRRFDLVVSDLGLPDASGHDLMRQLRQRHGLRGIALSGYGMEQDLLRSAEAGFVQHLVKPISIEKLTSVLHEILD